MRLALFYRIIKLYRNYFKNNKKLDNVCNEYMLCFKSSVFISILNITYNYKFFLEVGYISVITCFVLFYNYFGVGLLV